MVLYTPSHVVNLALKRKQLRPGTREMRQKQAKTTKKRPKTRNITPDPKKSEIWTVRYCPVCRARQWHKDGTCEWRAEHALFHGPKLLWREKQVD